MASEFIQPSRNPGQRLNSTLYNDGPIQFLLPKGKPANIIRCFRPFKKFRNDKGIFHSKSLFEMIGWQDESCFGCQSLPTLFMMGRGVDHHSVPIKNRSYFTSQHRSKVWTKCYRRCKAGNE